ncbi:MAG TPA: tetratricopeptide repeat protein [Usitatibacter sp.]|nr:tetratricopeptide repeat protein [Usitatibacter sp.]
MSIARVSTKSTMARTPDPLLERVVEFMRYSAPDPEGLERDIEQMHARLAQAIGDNEPLAIVDHAADLGTMLTTARREAEAVQLLRSHAALAEAHAGHEASAWYWNALATALQYTDHRAEAEHYFAKATGLSRLSGWPRILAMTLHHWGRNLVEQGRFAEAEERFSEALAIRIRIDDPRQERSRQALHVSAELRRSVAGCARS